MNSPRPARPVGPALCDHKQNPIAYLTCYHDRGRQDARARAQGVRPNTMNGVPLGPNGMPAIAAPPQIQHAIDAMRGVAHQYEAPEVQRGEQEKVPLKGEPNSVVIARQRAQGVVASGAAPMKSEWRKEQEMPWAPVENPRGLDAFEDGGQGLIVPPPLPSVMDRQPTHPNLDKSVAKFG